MFLKLTPECATSKDFEISSQRRNCLDISKQVNYENHLFLQVTGTKTERKLLTLFQKDGRSFSNDAKLELKELSQPTAVQNDTGMRHCVIWMTLKMEDIALKCWFLSTTNCKLNAHHSLTPSSQGIRL
jgi:hypothetical protein